MLGLQPLFMPVVMFSTFWVPTGFMPDWCRTVATWNPFTPILDACRSMLFGSIDRRALVTGILVLSTLAAATYAAATRLYVRAIHAE